MLKKLKEINIEKKALIYPLLMLSAMWFVFFLQQGGMFDSCAGAIIPLVPEGLVGVVFSPLLHGGLEHIFGNSVPMFVMMFLLFQFYPKIATKVFFLGWIFAGLLLWLLPPIDLFTGEYRFVCIIGASGVVYVLAFFLFFSGIFRKNKKLLTVALVVALYYGSLIWGIFPEELFSHLETPSTISWQAHLSGAIVGILLASFYRNIHKEKQPKYIWEFPNYYSEKDDKLWQDYIEHHPSDFLNMPQKQKEDIWKYLDELRHK